MTHEPDGGWYYQQILLGFNYRITDIQAALGCSQLANLDEWIARRHEIAARYDRAVLGTPIVPQRRSPDAHSAVHLYVVQVTNRKAVFDALRAAQVGVNVHYIPVHLQPDYQVLGFRPGDFPVAEAYYARALSLPMFPALTDADQDRVVSSLRLVLGA